LEKHCETLLQRFGFAASAEALDALVLYFAEIRHSGGPAMAADKVVGKIARVDAKTVGNYRRGLASERHDTLTLTTVQRVVAALLR
jgi:hypothetical protein